MISKGPLSLECCLGSDGGEKWLGAAAVARSSSCGGASGIWPEESGLCLTCLLGSQLGPLPHLCRMAGWTHKLFPVWCELWKWFSLLLFSDSFLTLPLLTGKLPVLPSCFPQPQLMGPEVGCLPLGPGVYSRSRAPPSETINSWWRRGLQVVSRVPRASAQASASALQ